MMTRKDFVALADALKSAHPGLTAHDTPAAREAWTEAVTAITMVCQGSNPAFSPPRFVAACVPAGRVGVVS